MKTKENKTVPLLNDCGQFYISFGSKIKRVRKSRGIGPGEFARRLNVTRPTTDGWEAGRHTVPLHKAVAIAIILGVRLEWLVADLYPGCFDSGYLTEERT